MKESDLEKKLVSHITKLGGIAYKFSSPNRKSVPDRLCIMPNGRAFFVELKAEGKAPTPLQRHEHELLRALGHTVLVIDNLEDVYAIA
jgi:hypothetical protein